MAEAASPSSHSSFCEEVFRSVAEIVDPGGRDHRSRLQSNEVDRTNILAPGFAAFPPSPPEKFSGIGPVGSCIQLQQRNCSRVSRDFLRRSTFPSSQRTGMRTSGLHFDGQDYLISELTECFCVLDRVSIKPHRHWRSRLHRIQSHACATGKISGHASHRDRRLSLR